MNVLPGYASSSCQFMVLVTPAIKTSKEPHRCRKAHPCSQAGDYTQHAGAEAIPCQSDLGIDRVEAASTFASQVMPPITDFTINSFDGSRNKTPFVIVALF